jgi:hypothetical protein
VLFKSLSILLLVVFAQMVNADALISNKAMKASTIIEYYIDEEGVRAELQIGIDSLDSFKNILPDAVYRQFGYGDEPYSGRKELFFTKELALLTPDGKSLQGELLSIGPAKRILRDPINGTPLPIQDNAPDVVAATLRYSFPSGKRPDQLIFMSPRARDIGFVSYHNQVAINDFRYIAPGYTLNLDWKDPWYSTFSAKNLRRQYSAPMSGFIYVEPVDVRKEIIARPKDLQRWVDLGLEGKKTITVEMQADIKQKVAAFLAEHQPVTIDGKPRKGMLDSVNFLERTLTSSRVIAPPEPLNLDAAIIGAIFVYPQKALPDNVVMTWDLWDERIINVPVSAVDQAGPLPSLLQRDWNKLEWQNFLKNPIVQTLNTVDAPAEPWRIMLSKGLPFIGLITVLALLWLAIAIKRKQALAMPVSAFLLFIVASVLAALLGWSNNPELDKANAIVGDLLHNIYRSFDYRDESDIYDILARSVSGELLTDIFLETKRSLVLENQGGARVKVKEVLLQSLNLKPDDNENSFTVEADWTVQGSVGHWGHVHQRVNRYKALMTMVVEEQQWKLKKITVLQEERL